MSTKGRATSNYDNAFKDLSKEIHN